MGLNEECPEGYAECTNEVKIHCNIATKKDGGHSNNS